MLLSNKDDDVIKKTGSLEAMIENADNGSESNGDASIEKVITELEHSLNNSNFYSKSRLTWRQRRGLYKALGFMRYLNKTYSIKCEVLMDLCWNVTHWELSADGQGRKEVSDMVAAGTPKLDVKTGLDISERVFGGGYRR